MNPDATRKAGGLLQWLLTDPTGEEVGEGVLGGALAGMGMLAADQSLEQTALQTLAAMGGGVALGMAGRRIGADLGRRIHKGALKNQTGTLATMARTMGPETTASGLQQQAALAKTAIQEALVKESSSASAQEALTDPRGFASRYGISAQDFLDTSPVVGSGRVAAAGLGMLEAMPLEQRQALANQILGKYRGVEDLITSRAAGSMDRGLEAIEEAMRDPELQKAIREQAGFEGDIESYIRTIRNGKVEPIKGEHVGRMLGRFIGDEVGVIGGLAAGSLAAQALGLESPKDRKIRQLEEQLAGQN